MFGASLAGSGVSDQKTMLHAVLAERRFKSDEIVKLIQTNFKKHEVVKILNPCLEAEEMVRERREPVCVKIPFIQ